MSCIIEQPAAGGDLLNYQTFDVGRKQEGEKKKSHFISPRKYRRLRKESIHLRSTADKTLGFCAARLISYSK